MERPGPLWWCWYALGGGLPTRYRDWVLRDLTAPWWRVRQLLRSILQVLPVALLVMVVLPTELWVRVMAVAGGVAVGMIYAAAYLEEATEHRALKARFARGTAPSVRDQAGAGARDAAAERYAERYRRDEPVTPRNSE